MYNELMFHDTPPRDGDAYVGACAFVPPTFVWPCAADGVALSHLMAFPATWFTDAGHGQWISIFVPYQPGSVQHYPRLRAVQGLSEARVIAYPRATQPVNQARYSLRGYARMALADNADEDDADNLASKPDGIDAWLQGPIRAHSGQRRLSIYGGDLDIALAQEKGLLSDGMGYLFLDEQRVREANGDAGHFFLQLG